MKFLGNRRFSRDLSGFESFNPRLFTSRNALQDISYPIHNLISSRGSSRGYPPTRDQLEPFKRSLNDVYGKVDREMMRDLFVDWPRNVVEEWAEDYNREFRLSFDIFYESATMESIAYIACFGMCDIDWHEYLDSFQQARTMQKLKEGL